MSKIRCAMWILSLLVALALFPARVQAAAPIAVLWEDGFPEADTAAARRADLEQALPQAGFVTAAQLDHALAQEATRLLVLPYGSSFPEQGWNAIHRFLAQGGNLLVLGGRPFTRPAYLEEGKWKLRAPSPAFAKQLFINEYQSTPGSGQASVRANEDFAFLDLPTFGWKQAFSLTIRLSDEDLYPRGGSAGSLDARLDALVWGVEGERRVSAPLIEIDHLKNNFVGGRWVLLACEPEPEFFSSDAGRDLVRSLAARALEGAEEFQVQPSWPLFLPGEPHTFHLRWRRFDKAPASAHLELLVAPEQGRPHKREVPVQAGEFPWFASAELPPSAAKGFHTVIARLYVAGALRGVYRTGFWIRDEAFLRSGPRVTVNQDFFELDGKPILVAGTTYMASDVQRQFFLRPNPYVWDRDMAEMRGAGFNMLRTGWWTAWDQVMKESGVVREEMLRALEAYLMTARRHQLPVQFTFFSFIPEVLGGANPYLDTEAVRRQKDLVTLVVGRFKDVPYLMWDLINEPSFSNPRRLWVTRPNGDAHELAAWNAWLKTQHASPGERAEAWRATPSPESTLAALPEEEEFSPRAVYRTSRGGNPLKAHDYYLFSQIQFLRWAEALRDAIRATGSRQLITVGQDEGGGRDRPSPAFYGEAVDFTTTHTWWMLDALLWDSLVAKQPGKPMLVQETGLQPELHIDEAPRRTPEGRAALLERKMAMAVATSAGAIQWLWHINSYMRDDGEATIGAVRADGTENQQAAVLRRMAGFAAAASKHLQRPQDPEVVIVTSQGFQYSALNGLALEAQMNAVRAMHYHCRVPASVVAENQLPRLGTPRLAVLPSPQTLSEDAWQRLLAYAHAGGTLLVTGSVERDAHWRRTARLAALGVRAEVEPLTYRQSWLELGETSVPVAFGSEKQAFLEALRFADGKSVREVPWGKGKILLASEPVELAEGLEATAQVYAWALARAGVEPPLIVKSLTPGILIRPLYFRDSTLYLLVSEAELGREVEFRDRRTGAEVRLHLPAQRARILLLRNRDHQVLADYAP
jgi:hypothetical protein